MHHRYRKTFTIEATDGKPFPPEMIVNKYRPIESNNYVNTSNSSDVYTSFKRVASDKLAFQLIWRKSDARDEAWMQVGENPPAGYK